MTTTDSQTILGRVASAPAIVAPHLPAMTTPATTWLLDNVIDR